MTPPSNAQLKLDFIPDFYTSDTHFGHQNILEIVPWRRQFASTIEAHDAYLIKAWNERVRPDQTVLHCGDFHFGTRESLMLLRAQLNGKIILIQGNHDRSGTASIAAGFAAFGKSGLIETERGPVYIRHRPQDFTTEEIDSAWQLLHGHLHDRSLSAELSAKCQGKLVNLCMDYSRTTAPCRWPGGPLGMTHLPTRPG